VTTLERQTINKKQKTKNNHKQKKTIPHEAGAAKPQTKKIETLTKP
jgi:hypothetical protein